MAQERVESNMDQRGSIVNNVISVLQQRAERYQRKAVETAKKKATVDGPWQSKQPDDMFRLELEAQMYQDRAVRYRRMTEELDKLRNMPRQPVVALGSVLLWEMNDPEVGGREETVIITQLGGGEIDEYRLVSGKAPVAKAIIGRKEGETVALGDITITIKRVF